jgi:hypothetical protein
MTRMRVFLFGILCVWSATAYAQTNTERYLLQERCGKRADEIFEKEYSSTHASQTKNGQLIIHYESHYSERLNKCFFLEITTAYERIEGRSTSFKIMRVFDANSNKEYASFGMGTCFADDKTCRTEEEFLQLIKGYMEN